MFMNSLRLICSTKNVRVYSICWIGIRNVGPLYTYKTYFALSRHVCWDNFRSYLVYKLMKSTKIKYIFGEIVKMHKRSTKGSILEEQLSSTDGFLLYNFLQTYFGTFRSFSIRTHLIGNILT